MVKTHHPRYVADDVSHCLRTSSIVKSQSRIWNMDVYCLGSVCVSQSCPWN